MAPFAVSLKICDNNRFDQNAKCKALNQVAEHSKRNHGAADGVPRMRLDLNVFFEVELVVNIMEHHMVPKHSVLTKEAKKALLARYKVTARPQPASGGKGSKGTRMRSAPGDK